jgi:hypothetical protein
MPDVAEEEEEEVDSWVDVPELSLAFHLTS